MKRIVVAVSLVLLATPALSQQQQSVLPITLSEKEYEQVYTFLNEVPAKYANPLLGILTRKQQEAQAAARMKEQKPETK